MNQFEWERLALDRGAERFAYDQREKRLRGQADETEAGLDVIRQRLHDVAAALEEQARPRPGVGGAYRQALKVAATRHNGEEFYQDWYIVAYIVLCTFLQVMYGRDQSKKYLTALALEIGGRLENDQQLYVFEQDNPAFIGKIRDSLQAQNVSSYTHKLKTYQKKYRDAEMGWEPWGAVKRTQVGLKCVHAILAGLDDLAYLTRQHNGKHMAYYVDTTLEFDDFIVDSTELRALTKPLNWPLTAPPLPYTREDGQVSGGYHTAALQRLSPFIKTRGQAHRDYVESHFPTKHMQAVNHLQSTVWQRNTEVFDVVQKYIEAGLTDALPRREKLEVPPHPGDDADDETIQNWKIDAKRIHGLNKQNAVALMQLNNSLDFLRARGEDPFWFTYSCDFRGRLYCNSPLASLQGEDHLKAMIRFHEGKEMGKRGLYWLAVHGANKYGFDKCSYADRVRWVCSIEQTLRDLVEHPLSGRSRSFLMAADKPFQFLAFAFEWARADYGRDPSTRGHLPIGLDGSCNGLQHFAALLRDRVGGASVNLTSSGDGVPADIYADVAERVVQLLQEGHPIPDGDTGRAIRTGILGEDPDRKLTKRPVMTLPYGATQQSCRQYTREYVKDNADKFGVHPDDDKAQWDIAIALTPVIWQAIKDCVHGAREAMDWLQKQASKVSRTGEPLRWRSPADFPVFQHYVEYESLRVRTSLFGDIKLKLNGDPKGVDAVRARNGVAPNFVHSLDSSHMVFTINEAFGHRGMTAMACIHDDYGVHAADTDEFFHVIRQTFVWLYHNTNWLDAWKRQIEGQIEGLELDPPPEQGDLWMGEVLESEFFFG